MSDELIRKVLKLGAQICRMHGHVAGNRVCQDWSEKTDILDSLTIEEKTALYFRYEQHNSGGLDFLPGRFPYDEMMISFIVATALEAMSQSDLQPTAVAAPLLPCPFCDGDPIRRKVLRDGYENFQDDPDAWAHYVGCRSCAAQGGWAKSVSSADRWWNMRMAGVVAPCQITE